MHADTVIDPGRPTVRVVPIVAVAVFLAAGSIAERDACGREASSPAGAPLVFPVNASPEQYPLPARHRRSPGTTLMWVGASVALGGYVVSAAFGIGMWATGYLPSGIWMTVPVAGPFITLASLPGTWDPTTLWVLGVVQPAGLILLLIGAMQHWPQGLDAPAAARGVGTIRAAFQPVLAPGFAGLAVNGEF